jgi:prephenate dehydrogenase
MENVAKGKIITIIGGNGQMGKLFAKYWQQCGAIVHILEHNDWSNAPQLIATVDLVLICTPIHDTCNIIERTCQFIAHNTILADLTSIKAVTIDCMLEHHSGPVLGLHPIFGPTIDSPLLQTIINCGGRETKTSSWVIDSLSQLGFNVKNMQAHEHDLAMSFIQGIEHFSSFTLGAFLHNQNIYPLDLLNLSSPIYQTKLTLLGRIFDQDAQLYADIIMSDKKRIDLIELYVHFMQEWVDKIKSNKKDEFIYTFKDTSKWMGNFTTNAQLASDNFLANNKDIISQIK